MAPEGIMAESIVVYGSTLDGKPVANPRTNRPLVAIDARLIGGTSTGDSTYWTGLLYGLAQIGPDVDFLLISNASAPAGIPESDRFHWITTPPRPSRWWSLVHFPLLARRLGASVTHVQYTLSPLARGGVTTVHDISFFIGPDWFKPRDRLVLQRTVPASIRRAKAVITVSETGKREIEQWIPAGRDKTTVTYNACPSWIHPVDPEPTLKELGVEQPYVLTVGTRWPRKNMQLAIDAADLLSSDLPHALVVTGKAGWGSQELGKRGRATGYVSNEQLCALYSGASAYLAPSRHEGFGIPLLEAFRCGCPVLCSSGGALPEVAGDAARVMNSWEAADWAAELSSMLRDSGNLLDLRQRGYERERQFTWEETARRTLAVYMGAMH